jgi:hypothetical protein
MPHKPDAISTLLKLTSFVMEARPGASLEYYRGRLDEDLDRAGPDAPACRIRAIAYGAFTSGEFELFHQRVPEEGWAYIIRRRRDAKGRSFRR